MSAWRMGLLDPQGPAEWREGVIGSRGNSEAWRLPGRGAAGCGNRGSDMEIPAEGGDAGIG